MSRYNYNKVILMRSVEYFFNDIRYYKCIIVILKCMISTSFVRMNVSAIFQKSPTNVNCSSTTHSNEIEYYNEWLNLNFQHISGSRYDIPH